MGARHEYLTLEDVDKLDGIVALACKNCGHRSFTSPSEIMRRTGRNKLFHRLRFKCLRCGKAAARLGLFIPLKIR